MTTNYTGLYIQKLTSGEIVSVQVRDTAGIDLPLSPEDYRARGIQPEIERLPDLATYRDTESPDRQSHENKGAC
jgi:hypothetical protein